MEDKSKKSIDMWDEVIHIVLDECRKYKKKLSFRLECAMDDDTFGGAWDVDQMSTFLAAVEEVERLIISRYQKEMEDRSETNVDYCLQGSIRRICFGDSDHHTVGDSLDKVRKVEQIKKVVDDSGTWFYIISDTKEVWAEVNASVVTTVVFFLQRDQGN